MPAPVPRRSASVSGCEILIRKTIRRGPNLDFGSLSLESGSVGHGHSFQECGLSPCHFQGGIPRLLYDAMVAHRASRPSLPAKQWRVWFTDEPGIPVSGEFGHTDFNPGGIDLDLRLGHSGQQVLCWRIAPVAARMTADQRRRRGSSSRLRQNAPPAFASTRSRHRKGTRESVGE